MALPTDPQARKDIPLAAVIDYFHDALAELALLIKSGNDQHNPGEPIYWNRDKSGDEADALLRHFVERGTIDSDGRRHSGKVAWRALALLQKEIEEQEGLPISRGSRSPKAEAAAQTPREAFVAAVTETEAPLEVPAFKPGDVVIATGKSYFGDIQPGDIVTIMEVNPAHNSLGPEWTLRVKKGDDSGYGMRPQDVRHYTGRVP
jgi:hypothetical protein